MVYFPYWITTAYVSFSPELVPLFRVPCSALYKRYILDASLNRFSGQYTLIIGHLLASSTKWEPLSYEMTF